jgi:hypothetical protein
VVYVHETFREVVELPILPLQLEETLAKFARREADEHDIARHQGIDIHHLKDIKVPALCFNSLFEMPIIKRWGYNVAHQYLFQFSV